MPIGRFLLWVGFIGSSVCALGQTRVDYSALPLSFQPTGVHDRSDGRFIATGNGYRFSLMPAEVDIANVRLRLAGANPEAQITGLDRLPGRTFYLTGRDRQAWRLGIENYSRVKYTGVYPGIDLVFYGNQNRLEYDFVIAPEQDVKQVRLKIEGAKSIRLDAGGNLMLTTAEGEVSLLKPLVYQQISGKRKEIAANFQVQGDQVGFRVAAYDHRQPLIVDPVLNYARYVGRSINDKANGIAAGADGSIYVAGVAPAMGATEAGASQDEAFVAHISADGKTLESMTYLGGSGPTDARGIALDGAGNIYITGETKASDFPVLNAIQPSCGGKCTGDA